MIAMPEASAGGVTEKRTARCWRAGTETRRAAAGAGVLAAWKELVVQEIVPARDDDEF